jgi:hypothetical protein
LGARLGAACKKRRRAPAPAWDRSAPIPFRYGIVGCCSTIAKHGSTQEGSERAAGSRRLTGCRSFLASVTMPDARKFLKSLVVGQFESRRRPM